MSGEFMAQKAALVTGARPQNRARHRRASRRRGASISRSTAARRRGREAEAAAAGLRARGRKAIRDRRRTRRSGAAGAESSPRPPRRSGRSAFSSTMLRSSPARRGGGDRHRSVRPGSSPSTCARRCSWRNILPVRFRKGRKPRSSISSITVSGGRRRNSFPTASPRRGWWWATQTLAQALAPRRIRVNAVGPGPCCRIRRKEIRASKKKSRACCSNVPSPRPRSPNAVIYLVEARKCYRADDRCRFRPALGLADAGYSGDLKTSANPRSAGGEW